MVDQIVHILSLLALAWLSVRFSWVPDFSGIGYKPLVVLAGFIATVQGAGFLVAIFTKRLIDENNLELDGLLNGGKLIGQLERCLIFLFIFIDQPAGIRFLVAAKSIFPSGGQGAKTGGVCPDWIAVEFFIAIALSAVTRWTMELEIFYLTNSSMNQRFVKNYYTRFNEYPDYMSGET